jgi:hypothetical protein
MPRDSLACATFAAPRSFGAKRRARGRTVGGAETVSQDTDATRPADKGGHQAIPKLSLFEGDILSRLFAFLRIDTAQHPRTFRRILVVFLLTWLPVFVLAAIGSVLVGPTPRESFLFDVAALAQFLVVMPLLLWAETYVDGRIQVIGGHLLDSGLVAVANRQAYERLLTRMASIRRHWLGEAVCLVVAYASTWGWLREELTNGVATWHARLTPVGEYLTVAGWWAGFVAVPAVNFVIFRWAWKIALWCYCLRRISMLRLHVVPTHPDRAGGLGFVGRLQARFGVLIFAIGVMVMAITFQKVVIEGNRLLSFAALGPIAAYIILAPTAFVLPLLFFTGALARAKRASLDRYAAVIARYCRSVDTKSLEPNAPRFSSDEAGEAFGGLADAQDTYGAVEHMRLIPFDAGTLTRLVASAVTPMLPLLLQVVPLPKPVRDVLSLFLGAPSP